MKKNIVDVRAHRRLRLKHPDNKLPKFFRIRRLGFCRPLQLPIDNGKLQASTRFTRAYSNGETLYLQRVQYGNH
jgi:hypothetical protein